MSYHLTKRVNGNMSWGGGVGSTMPMEGGVVSPFMVSVNVHFRLTHVSSVDTLLRNKLLCNVRPAFCCTWMLIFYHTTVYLSRYNRPSAHYK